jgi:hypothetical protein
VLRTPVRAPRADAYAERWVGTIRRAVLDRMLIVGCPPLRSVLAEYADQYNGHRPHRALGQAPPLGPAEPAVQGRVSEVDQRLGCRSRRLLYPPGMITFVPAATWPDLVGVTGNEW